MILLMIQLAMYVYITSLCSYVTTVYVIVYSLQLPASVNEAGFCSAQHATIGAMECFNKVYNIIIIYCVPQGTLLMK